MDVIRVFSKRVSHLRGQLGRQGLIPVDPAVHDILLSGPRGAGLLVPFLAAPFVPTPDLPSCRSHVLFSPLPLLKI